MYVGRYSYTGCYIVYPLHDLISRVLPQEFVGLYIANNIQDLPIGICHYFRLVVNGCFF